MAEKRSTADSTSIHWVNPLRSPARDEEAPRQRFYYDFRILTAPTSDWDIEKYIERTATIFRPIVDGWSSHASREWQLRNYLAVKLIAQATLFAASLEFSREHNLVIVTPYLRYYAALHSARALLFTCPDLPFEGEASISLSQTKIINQATNLMGRLGSKLRKEHERRFKQLRDQREVFSYGLPLSGKMFLKEHGSTDEDALSLATFYCEIAQLNSEILYFLLQRHQSAAPKVEPTEAQVRLACYHGPDREPDWDDLYRFSKHFRAFGMPVPLDWTATEGFVDDVCAGWTPDDDDEMLFNPDENPRIIFNFS